ncbi:response regulator transcription factor [Psychromonas sp. psych-6C06]|uniref:response regulator transcription factor n=1 Tax=Psychromonas sp. psych-6C06 TaxID=2058089 RepID=UPI00187C4CAA|nr:response regulator transcription factor [Psychromonas sp. psych-6C06]
MSNSKVLIIDDDAKFSEKLSAVLQDNGFDVEQSYSSEEGLIEAKMSHFQLIMVATILPALDGFFVLEKLRKQSDIPVIMLCNRDCEQLRLEGYRKGADDYLVKSFSFTEIMVRIQTLLRRTLGVPFSQSEKLECNGLMLQKREQLVCYDNKNIILTPIEFRLLWTLVDSRKQVLSKPYLYQIVLDRPFKPFDRTLDMHLSRIRKKLVEIGMNGDCLRTIHGKGYRFS